MYSATDKVKKVIISKGLKKQYPNDIRLKPKIVDFFSESSINTVHNQRSSLIIPELVLTSVLPTVGEGCCEVTASCKIAMIDLIPVQLISAQR
jgi:hypothetical protein